MSELFTDTAQVMIKTLHGQKRHVQRVEEASLQNNAGKLTWQWSKEHFEDVFRTEHGVAIAILFHRSVSWKRLQLGPITLLPSLPKCSLNTLSGLWTKAFSRVRGPSTYSESTHKAFRKLQRLNRLHFLSPLFKIFELKIAFDSSSNSNVLLSQGTLIALHVASQCPGVSESSHWRCWHHSPRHKGSPAPGLRSFPSRSRKSRWIGAAPASAGAGRRPWGPKVTSKLNG